LEWCYRLLKEPRRMWKRYIIGNLLFMWNICKE
ncbi:MAG: glycosyltransferase, partial [Phocaeicola vulgatus]|nr:glycosyltransferase [Phocaeicola vulgatus]